MEKFLYVASQDAEGGILRMRLDAQGQLHLEDFTPMDRVSYLCREGNRLYALLREPFQMQSGVQAFAIHADGTLEKQGEAEPVHGAISAHLWAKDGVVYTANYLSGTTTRMPDKLIAHNGKGPNPDRQTCSHPHCITPTPDERYICICDLGTDRIEVYTLDLEKVSEVSVVPGSGPRHLVFSEDGQYAYCSNEMGSTVSVFSYKNGVLTHLDAVSTLPADYEGESTASAIRLAGDRLYVSNRGHDSVCVFSVDGASITPLRWIPCGGQSPREMTLMDGWILCGNELSHDICVLPMDGDETSQPVCCYSVTRPWCILPLEL